jgi:hypothetical protein
VANGMVWVTVRGEGGGVGQVCLLSVTKPYTTWPRWREHGGGLRCLPLIRTRESVPMTRGSELADRDPALSVSDLQDANKNN